MRRSHCARAATRARVGTRDLGDPRRSNGARSRARLSDLSRARSKVYHTERRVHFCLQHVDVMQRVARVRQRELILVYSVEMQQLRQRRQKECCTTKMLKKLITLVVVIRLHIVQGKYRFYVHVQNVPGSLKRAVFGRIKVEFE